MNGDAQKYTLLRSGGTIGFVLFSLFLAVTRRPDLTNNNSIGFHALVAFALFALPVLAWKKEPKRPKIPIAVPDQEEGMWYDLAFVVGLVIIGLNRVSMSSIASFFFVISGRRIGGQCNQLDECNCLE